MLGSLNTHVHNPGIPSPYKSGAPKPPFLGRLRNSTATLTACIFGKKHDIYNRPSALTTTRERLCIIPKCHELWYTNGFKLDCHFLLTLYKYCFLRHCQASPTEISNRAKALKNAKGLLHCPEISWTLVHRRLKMRPDFFLPTLTILLCPSPSHTSNRH